MEIPVGARVSVTAGLGRVRWSGTNPPFAAGKWVGVELDKSAGRNDGSVNGESYFSCKDKHGVFVRPSQVKILDGEPQPNASTSILPPPVPSSSSTRDATPATPPRLTSSVSSRSIAASSPTPSSSRRPSTAASTSRPGPTPTNAGLRSSQATRTLTRTVSSASNVSTRNAGLSRKVATPSPPPPAPVSLTGESLRAPTPDTHSSVPQAPRPLWTPTPVSAPPASSAAAEPVRTLRAPTPVDNLLKREFDELRIKFRILEARKVEDQERIKFLEAKAAEGDAMRAARGKLQAKFQDLQTGLVAAQRASKDLQSENKHLESRLAELLEQLEMATLDREMAEEKVELGVADALKMEERLAELEIEVAVLREENAEFDKPPVEGESERSSMAFVQLERHNERLKDALIRLRDVSTEAEKEHRSRIAELEKELSATDDLSGRNDLAEAKLSHAEAQIEDLKLQLDDALGAEDMLEQLTERNLQMSEKIEEMRIAMEDLESLKELNDELEENHVESEKQLAGEVATLETSMREESARSEAMAESILDMEQTITQFRDLVSTLQSELEDVRSQHESHLTASETGSKESHAVMNLNLKLQSTAVKAQSKIVEMELQRLQALQLAEHLRIVQTYLPPAYHETEADSTLALLFFQRMAFKAELLVTVISQLHGLPLALHSATAETLVGICELRGKLGHFAALNRRFACILRHVSPDEWLVYSNVLMELGAAHVEKRVDSWLELLRTDAFEAADCARDLESLIAQFDHLAETAFDRPQLDLGERQLHLALGFDFDLDNFAAAVGFARQAVRAFTSEDDVEIITDDSSLEEGIYTPVQGILDQVRSIKGPSSKLVAILDELTADSSALAPAMLAPLQNLSASVSNAVDIAVQLAQRIAAHIAQTRSAKLPLNLLDIDRFLVEITMDIVGETDMPPWEIISQFVSRLAGDLAAILPQVKSAEKNGSLAKMLSPPPWISRSASIKAAASRNPEAERMATKMSEEIRELMREVKIRDQGLQEAGVKTETLERRLEAMRKQTDTIIELENDVAKSKKQEKVYEDALEQLQAELDLLEAENAKLRQSQGQIPGHGDRQANRSSAPGVVEPIILGASGLETSQLLDQIESLRSAIRYLRSENALLHSKDLYSDLLALPPLSHDFDVDAVPELDPTSPGSPTSSESDFSLRTPPSRRSLETESRILFREVAAFQASPKVVNLAKLGSSKKWQSRKHSPEQQVWEWTRQQSKLERKVAMLADRVGRVHA